MVGRRLFWEKEVFADINLISMSYMNYTEEKEKLGDNQRYAAK